MLGSINSIESMGAVDGPGLRTVVFLNVCHLRCKYCQNPETWVMGDKNYSPEDLVKKIVRYKAYYGKKGGVTFSGGEPLIQYEFLINTCKLLKQENINIALDTAGIGVGHYEEILQNIDLIIFDIKDITEERFRNLTGGDINKAWEFLNVANKLNKKFWVRQVVVPGLHDNLDYITNLAKYIKEHINNVEKIEFLPYHKLGDSKYEKLGIKNPYENKEPMDSNKCIELYEKFMSIYM